MWIQKGSGGSAQIILGVMYLLAATQSISLFETWTFFVFRVNDTYIYIIYIHIFYIKVQLDIRIKYHVWLICQLDQYGMIQLQLTADSTPAPCATQGLVC